MLTLRWQPAQYSRDAEYADYKGERFSGRFVVKRKEKRSRTWVATYGDRMGLRKIGEFDSKDAAKLACHHY